MARYDAGSGIQWRCANGTDKLRGPRRSTRHEELNEPIFLSYLSALAHELARLEGSVIVHITHIVPGVMDADVSQIAQLGLPHTIRALRAGQFIELG